MKYKFSIGCIGILTINLYFVCKLSKPNYTHLHILNLNTLIYLHAPGDFAKSNLNIFRQLYLSISQVILTLIPFTNGGLPIVPGRPNTNIISPSYSCNSFPGNPIMDAISRS